MNAEMTTDWESWEVEAPPPDFVDQVMAAALNASRLPSPARGPRRSARWLSVLAAATVVAGSFTVLAMIVRQARRPDPFGTEPKQAPNDRPVLSVNTGGETGSIASIAPRQVEHAPGKVVDRKLRDALRARVVPSLERQGVERDPHTGLTIPAGSNGPSHNLSREYLQARIRQDFYPLAMACYESALAKRPELRGKVVIDFMIVGDAKVGGIVDQAKINERTDITDSEFTGCISESMLSVVFAPPDNDGWVTVTYPFEFSPDGDDEAPQDH